MGQMAFSYDFNMKEHADDVLNVLGPIDKATSYVLKCIFYYTQLIPNSVALQHGSLTLAGRARTCSISQVRLTTGPK